MVGGSQARQTPLAKDYYLDAIDAILAENGIARSDPGYIVSPDASFETAVRYTDWYCRGNVRPNPHYRYDRYREIVGHWKPTGRREAHVDIGCGAGLFSWAFLDWAREAGLSHDSIDLYGLDHSTPMINLAHQLRERLAGQIPDYPILRYTDAVDTFLQELYIHHRARTDYTITLGHVLVQAQHPDAILDFTRVIAQVVGFMDIGSTCVLMAVDARLRPDPFAVGWDKLLEILGRSGIRHELSNVPITAINDPGCAKIARLYPASG